MKLSIYMKQPEGFKVGYPKKKVCLSRRSLYGLNLASLVPKLDEFTIKHGLQRSSYDECVYFKKVKS